MLKLAKASNKNIFSAKILAVEGLQGLSIERTFELPDASPERSAASRTIKLKEHSISDYLTSNITLLRLIISEGCGGSRTLERRGRATEEWLAESILMKYDNDDAYTAVIEINLSEIKEPFVCFPSDPTWGLTVIGTSRR